MEDTILIIASVYALVSTVLAVLPNKLWVEVLRAIAGDLPKFVEKLAEALRKK